MLSLSNFGYWIHFQKTLQKMMNQGNQYFTQVIYLKIYFAMVENNLRMDFQVIAKSHLPMKLLGVEFLLPNLQYMLLIQILRIVFYRMLDQMVLVIKRSLKFLQMVQQTIPQAIIMNIIYKQKVVYLSAIKIITDLKITLQLNSVIMIEVIQLNLIQKI